MATERYAARSYKNIVHKAHILKRAASLKLPPNDAGPHELELTAFLRHFNTTPHYDAIIREYVRVSSIPMDQVNAVTEFARKAGLSEREWVARESLAELDRFAVKHGWVSDDDFKTATWFKQQFGIPCDRLRKASARGALPTKGENRRKQYHVPTAKRLWPEDFEMSSDVA